MTPPHGILRLQRPLEKRGNLTFPAKHSIYPAVHVDLATEHGRRNRGQRAAAARHLRALCPERCFSWRTISQWTEKQKKNTHLVVTGVAIVIPPLLNLLANCHRTRISRKFGQTRNIPRPPEYGFRGRPWCYSGFDRTQQASRREENDVGGCSGEKENWRSNVELRSAGLSRRENQQSSRSWHQTGECWCLLHPC
jgi:hypothetical protein